MTKYKKVVNHNKHPVCFTCVFGWFIIGMFLIIIILLILLSTKIINIC